MPRDASDTRIRLMAAAEQLFARRGVHQATTREILATAGQRNVSALTYHFGSREQLLWAILDRHNGSLEAGRTARLVAPLERMPTRDLVAALVVPYAGCLAAAGGRDYLRIVAQLTDLFPMWRTPPVNAPVLNGALETLEARAGGTAAVQRQRVVAMMMLMTTACADRARAVDDGEDVEVDGADFAAGLVDMLVALLEAPVGAPLAGPGGGRPRAAAATP